MNWCGLKIECLMFCCKSILLHDKSWAIQVNANVRNHVVIVVYNAILYFKTEIVVDN